MNSEARRASSGRAFESRRVYQNISSIMLDMKQIKNISNFLIFLSSLYLVFRLLTWVTHSQPAEGTRTLSLLNQLTVAALVLLAGSFIASKSFVKHPDKTTKTAQKISLGVIVLLGLFAFLVVAAIVWAIHTQTLFDGWEY